MPQPISEEDLGETIGFGVMSHSEETLREREAKTNCISQDSGFQETKAQLKHTQEQRDNIGSLREMEKVSLRHNQIQELK